MIKLSIAIAAKNALPSAFVVYRGFEECIPHAAELGYDGVELALKDVSEINPTQLDVLLKSNGLSVSCVSTGQVFADTGYMFTDTDQKRRTVLTRIFKNMIDFASEYGQLVNIGRIRGMIGEDGKAEAEMRFIELAQELCDYAQKRGSSLVLEPVNRYEINFINTVEQGVELLKKVNRPNMKLMPDVFHMNIEDVKIGAELAKHIDHISYIHLADSNRRAPGWGHTDFRDIFTNLKKVDYSGWVSVEILPVPDPTSAARQAGEYLKPFITEYNAGVVDKE
jgi:sugar phosphate isomerase/epimerase